MRRPWFLVLLAATVVVTAVTACADDEGTSDSPSTTAVPTTAVSTTAVPTTIEDATELVVQVFFLDQDAFNIGRLPYVRPVERTVAADAPEVAVLEALFAGPTPAERAGGLRFVASGATGIAAFELTDGTAHVTLAGGCSSGGSTFTVADEIVATLVQFTSVDAVKIYDPDGQTASPDEPGDSIPFCLEP